MDSNQFVVHHIAKGTPQIIKHSAGPPRKAQGLIEASSATAQKLHGGSAVLNDMQVYRPGRAITE